MSINHVIVLSEEGLKRVFIGLGELAAKISHELILDIESQLRDAEQDVSKYVAMVKTHLAPHEAKIKPDVVVDQPSSGAKEL